MSSRPPGVATDGSARSRLGLAVFLAAAIGLAVYAVKQTGRARDQERAALSRALAGQSQALLQRRPDQALLVGLEAYRRDQTSEARSALLGAVQRTRSDVLLLSGNHDQVVGVAFSPDGKTIATAGADGQVVLASTDGARRTVVTRRSGDAMRVLAFDPGGKLLAAGTNAARSHSSTSARAD